ncbi:MAG: hypothetical protein KDD40_09120 [Bdellovibrionales bacterium]|nr:hypothetical protein [Bdellovibrionales bacterium]
MRSFLVTIVILISVINLEYTYADNKIDSFEITFENPYVLSANHLLPTEVFNILITIQPRNALINPFSVKVLKVKVANDGKVELEINYSTITEFGIDDKNTIIEISFENLNEYNSKFAGEEFSQFKITAKDLQSLEQMQNELKVNIPIYNGELRLAMKEYMSPRIFDRDVLPVYDTLHITKITRLPSSKIKIVALIDLETKGRYFKTEEIVLIFSSIDEYYNTFAKHHLELPMLNESLFTKKDLKYTKTIRGHYEPQIHEFVKDCFSFLY